MKALPKRKGNSRPRLATKRDRGCLNESPSEKEGKFNTEGMLRGDFEASMKALPKRKGNVVVFAPPAFWKLTASMKALPKRKGN